MDAPDQAREGLQLCQKKYLFVARAQNLAQKGDQAVVAFEFIPTMLLEVGSFIIKIQVPPFSSKRGGTGLVQHSTSSLRG
jgi:hypothetical protein